MAWPKAGSGDGGKEQLGDILDILILWRYD